MRVKVLVGDWKGSGEDCFVYCFVHPDSVYRLVTCFASFSFFLGYVLYFLVLFLFFRRRLSSSGDFLQSFPSFARYFPFLFDLLVIVSSVFFGYVFLFCAFRSLLSGFPVSSLLPLGPFSSPPQFPQHFFGRLLVFLYCLCFSPVLGISAPCFILRVRCTCGSSFSFGALVRGVNMRLPLALFACLCLLLLLVAALVVARLLSYSMIPSFCYCRYLEVSIPSPCVSVLFRSVPLFQSRLVFLFGVWSVCSSLITQCHWCLLPCSLSCGNTRFCSASASLGSLVPFATWSPSGTIQGLLRPLSLSSQGYFHVVVSLLCRSPFHSSDSFPSKVPLATWLPFWMSLASFGALV